jgi:hypothetical protein
MQHSRAVRSLLSRADSTGVHIESAGTGK